MALQRSRWSMLLDRRAERRLANRERRAARRLATRRRHVESPATAERIEARIARRSRFDQWRARLPYLAWHKELQRPPAMARWEQFATLALGVGSGVAVVASGVSPTASATADLLWSLALGVAVALAGTLARRRVLLAVAAVATVGGWGWWSLAGVLALVLASGAVYQRDGVITGERLMHAASASLALQALVRMRGWSWTPLWVTVFVVAVAIGAVLVAGWWRSPRRVRTPIAVVVGTGVVAVAVMGATLWRLIDGVSLSDGTELAAGGTLESLDDLAASADDFAAAEQRLANLQRRVDTPLLAPLRLLPFASQQVVALDTVIDVGLDLAGRAGDGAALVEGAELRPEPGRVDVAAVRSLEAPLADMVTSLKSAEEELASVDSPWLASPVRSASERLAGAAAEALPPTELALLGVQTVPGMLGADGPRRWLIQLVDTEYGTNEWQVVVADNGKLIPTDEFGDDSGVGVSIGDLSLNPDYPSAAAAASERFRTTTGRPIQGMVTLGRVGAQAISSTHAASPRGPTDSVRGLIEGWLASSLPAPLAWDVTRDAVAGKQILVWTSAPEEANFLEAVRVEGSLRPFNGDADLLFVGVREVSGGSDFRITRQVTYRTDFDAASGEADILGEVVITREGNTRTPGDVELSIITGLNLEWITVSGIEVIATNSEVNGWKKWTLRVFSPSGAPIDIQWRASGTFAPFNYEFAWQPQPLTGPAGLRWLFKWNWADSEGDFQPLIELEDAPGALTFRPRLRAEES